MQHLIEKTTQAFWDLAGGSPDWVVQAPGRVNLIGEHTDYNDGFVLPCAINFTTVVAAGVRDDAQLVVQALDADGQIDRFVITDPFQAHEHWQWPAYVRGVVAAIQDALRDKNAAPWHTGANLVIAGDVPQGAGLSSSASLEVALGLTFKTMFDLPLSPVELALAGQAAENRYVGCNCGIMDQLISVAGEANSAMLLDCRDLEHAAVTIPAGARVVIVDSNKPRGLVDSAYNERRAQCEAAARHFGVPALRDVTLSELSVAKADLEVHVFKRARHVISENARTQQACAALRAGDLQTMGQLMAASHASMRDDFEITVPEIDYLVDLIKDVVGPEGGVRMTGGGFGGCVVALLPEHLVAPVKDAVQSHYTAHTGLKERIFVCSASAGAGVVSGT